MYYLHTTTLPHRGPSYPHNHSDFEPKSNNVLKFPNEMPHNMPSTFSRLTNSLAHPQIVDNLSTPAPLNL